MEEKTRLTVRLPESLKRELKTEAARQGIKIETAAARAFERWLAEHQAAERK